MHPFGNLFRAAVKCAATFALGAPLLSGLPAVAASPEYCAVYAHAAADPDGAASASAADTEALQRAYDRAYYECLNLDDEPKLPADFADRSLDPVVGVGEGDISGDDEKPTAKTKSATPALKKVAAAVKPRKKRKWESGFVSGSAEWRQWCTETYKSFDPATGQYNAFSGEKKLCK